MIRLFKSLLGIPRQLKRIEENMATRTQVNAAVVAFVGKVDTFIAAVAAYKASVDAVFAYAQQADADDAAATDMIAKMVAEGFAVDAAVAALSNHGAATVTTATESEPAPVDAA